MKSTRSNFGFKRKSGILMSVSSLPCKYGIGSIGAPSFKFIGFLKECKQKVWQVLPLNPTAFGDSPYQSPCSFAGNPYFIDLESLKADGLLSAEDLQGAIDDGVKVNYGELFQKRIPLLKKAHARFVATDKYEKFVKDNASWLDDYALFMALKEQNDFKSWSEWGDMRQYAVAKQSESRYAAECEFYKFLQFEFFSQWKKVRAYAKKNGVESWGICPSTLPTTAWKCGEIRASFCLTKILSPPLLQAVRPTLFPMTDNFGAIPCTIGKR